MTATGELLLAIDTRRLHRRGGGYMPQEVLASLTWDRGSEMAQWQNLT